MHAKWHLFVSLTVAVCSLPFNQATPFLSVKLFGHEIAVLFLCLVTGVVVDIDHIIDFRINRRLIHESLESRFRNGRMFVAFHGIENIVILVGLSIFFPFLDFPTISYICHIIMDVHSNGAPYQAYFYTVRLRKIIKGAL